jgi:hypothetical protein
MHHDVLKVENAQKHYENFDADRKKTEAQEADLEDQKALELLILKSKKK